MGIGHKVLVDVLTPKHALFFRSLVDKMEGAGLEICVTTREYSEVEGILPLVGLKARAVGRHGGGDPYAKLFAYAERVRLLGQLVKREKPDLILSCGSPEAARVAFGVSIPHIMANDSPHASAVGRLTAPLSRRIFTPWIIPKRLWYDLGATKGTVEHYHGLDPAMWLKDFKPKESVLSELHLDGSRPIISYRPEEFQAAYLGLEEPVTPILIKRAMLRAKTRLSVNPQLVVLARYGSTRPYYKYFRGEATYTGKCVDARSLIHFSSVFIGGGGTMLSESALMGTPTISMYPGTTRVEQYLQRKALIYKTRKGSPIETLLAWLLSLTGSERQRMRSRAGRILAAMETPSDKMLPFVANLLGR